MSIFDLFSRAVVKLADDSRALRTLKTLHLFGEVRSNVEHVEPYGFTSVPHYDAEAVTVSLDGDRDHTIAIVVTDRRYRIKNLKTGEVAVFDDLGRSVLFSRTGLVIDGVSDKITVKTSASVEILAPIVHMSGDLNVDGNVTSKGQINDLSGCGGSSMSSMRSTYNNHTHVHGDSSSQRPTQQM